MTRDELYEWLETCPTSGWHWVGEDGVDKRRVLADFVRHGLYPDA